MQETMTRTKSGFALSSIEARENSKPNNAGHYQIIIETMRKIGIPVIGKHIANFKGCPLDKYDVGRRLSEMEKMGMVKVVGRCPNIKNRPLLWELTESYKIG